MKNNDFLNSILQKIGAQIPCPKCRKVFSDPSIQLVSLEGKDIQLRTQCAHCQASINIGANVKKTVQNKAVTQQTTLNMHEKNAQWLSPEGVRNIAKSVRVFNGNDIRQIFD